VEDLNIPIIEEIITASANIEMETGFTADYVGLSYDAFIQIKKELEASLDKSITASDINNALSIDHIIVPGMLGIDYKFLNVLSIV
jgi:hypothetical protein